MHREIYILTVISEYQLTLMAVLTSLFLHMRYVVTCPPYTEKQFSAYLSATPTSIGGREGWAFMFFVC